MESNNGILTEEKIRARTKFWSKRQFRTWTKKELDRSSMYMQKLLAALKEFSMDEIKATRALDRYSLNDKNDPRRIVRWASQIDLDYAISIAPKTFKVKQG